MRTCFICLFTMLLGAWSSSPLAAQEDAGDFGGYLTAMTNARLTNSTGDLGLKIFSFGPMEQATRDEIQEDANILNHLIRMNAPTRQDTVMGVSVTQAMGENSAIYIQGTGMVFVYHVGYPVAQTDEEAAESDETDEPKSTWDRAREAIRTTDQSGFGLVVNRQPDAPALAYSAERVDALEKVMATALREAGNFRNLEPGNSITVYVYGPMMLKESGPMRSVMAWRVSLKEGPEGSVQPRDLAKMQFMEAFNGNVGQFGLYQGVMSD
ncbi:MAG: hypothetical protein ACR2NP_02590 [Pirellulaceae bacterium]